MGRCGPRWWTLFAVTLAALLASSGARAWGDEAPGDAGGGRAGGASASAGGPGGPGGPSGDVRSEGARSSAADERFRRPDRRRWRGEDLESYLRRRLAEEERSRAEQIEVQNAELLRRLFQETTAIPEGRLSLGPGPFEGPSDAFLRAVTPPRFGYAPIQRRGFERFAYREVAREWRRRYKQDLELRGVDRQRLRAIDLWLEAQAMWRALDENARIRWCSPFPSYWEGHPASKVEPRVIGEELEIVRVGRIALGNDFDVEYDAQSFAYAFSDRDRDADPDPAEVARRPDRPRHADPSQAAPDGNIYTGGRFTLDGRVSVGFGMDAVAVGFLRRVTGELEWAVLDPYDRRRLFAAELSFIYDPDEERPAVALMLELVRF